MRTYAAYRYSQYKAWQHQIITSRVNPRDTSRECPLVVRYNAGQPAEGYTSGFAGARRARCAIMPIGMPVCVSVSTYLSALKNLSKKSLILLFDVEAES